MSLINTDNIPYRKVVVPEYDVPIKMVSEAVINALPKAEPKPGKWVWDCDKEGWKCSECNTLIHDIFIFEDEMIEDPCINFCMECGADMRGKNESGKNEN